MGKALSRSASMVLWVCSERRQDVDGSRVYAGVPVRGGGITVAATGPATGARRALRPRTVPMYAWAIARDPQGELPSSDGLSHRTVAPRGLNRGGL